MESSHVFSEEEVRSTLETSAATGKFWEDWEKLKRILSYQLKQVLAEYPEANMTSDQQTSSLGETFPELVKRLDDALDSFDEGPPFTLQRLCEILLSAKSIYPKLLKLSLALEKNLLVTSTLTISNDPCRVATDQNSNGTYEESRSHPPPTNSEENGLEPGIGDTDEIMTEVQIAEAAEATADMETVLDSAKSSEAE